LIQLREQIPDMKDGNGVAGDGDCIPPNPKMDRCQLFDQSDVSVLLSTEIAKGFIVAKIDTFRDGCFRRFFQMASIVYRTV
jgi:hypothetical protein